MATIRVSQVNHTLVGDLRDATISFIASNRSQLDLGNAAGSRIVSATIVPEPWYRESNTKAWSNGENPNYTEQKGVLVIKHLGLDLAHRKASDVVSESRFDMVLPIGTKEIELS